MKLRINPKGFGTFSGSAPFEIFYFDLRRTLLSEKIRVYYKNKSYLLKYALVLSHLHKS